MCCAFNSRLCFFLSEQCFLAWSRMNRLFILSCKHWTGLHRGPTSTSTSTFLDGNKSLQPHSNIWWKKQQQKKHLEEQRHLQHHSDAHCGAKTCFTERFLWFFSLFISRCVFGLACGLTALNPDMFVMPCVQIQIKFQFVRNLACTLFPWSSIYSTIITVLSWSILFTVGGVKLVTGSCFCF